MQATCNTYRNVKITAHKWDERPAVGVVLAAGGYPGSYTKGDEIHGLQDCDTETAKIFHAGTKLIDDKVVTNGGRVLCATALGSTIADAQKAAYDLADKINWKDMYLRRDIAWRALQRERT